MPAQPSALSVTSQWIPWLISGAISNKGAGRFAFTSAESGQHRLQAVVAGEVVGETVIGDAVRTAVLTGLPLNSNPTIQVRSENGGLSTWRTLALAVPAMPANAGSILVPSGLTVDTSDPARVVISWTDNANNEADYHLVLRGPAGFVKDYYAAAPATSITIPVLPGVVYSGTTYPVFGQTYVVQIAARGGKYKLRKFKPLETAFGAEVQFDTAPPQIVLTNLPTHAAAWNGLTFNFQIETSETPTSFAVSSGSLPSGVTLDTGTGLVSGTPSDAAATYRANLRANNAGGHDIAQLEIQLSTPSFSVRLASGALLIGLDKDLGAAFTQNLLAVAFGPIAAANAWTLDQGPDWLGIDASTGELSGTPAASGTYTCQLTVGNGTQSNPWTFAIVVVGVRIASADNLTVYTGQAFTFTILASPDGCTFTSGDLPAGVTLTGNVLAGTVATAGDYEIDIGAYLENEGVSQAFTLHVLQLVTIDDEWEMVRGQPQLQMLQWNGAGHVNQWCLTGAPPGLSIDFAVPLTGPSTYTPRAKVSGIPTAAGIYDAEITAQIVDSATLYRTPIRISVSGGLFLAWYHKDASRREVQLFLRSMKVDGYYFQAGSLMLVRGDAFTLHVLLRDGPIHGDELGLATVETGLTDLKLMIRPKDDWDAEPWIEVGGAVTTAAIGDHTVFVLTFTPGGPETEIEKVFKSVNESPGADPTEAKLEGMGEVVAMLNGNVLTSLPFGVVIRQDLDR